MSLTVCCVLRDGKRKTYSAVWVERLHRQVMEHLKPDRFVCMADQFFAPVVRKFSGVEVHQLPRDWPGWWSKICLFAPGVFSGKTVFFDLDTLVLRPIPNLQEKMEQHPFMMLTDFYHADMGASGVMMWTPSPATERIFSDFNRAPDMHMLRPYGDGGFIQKYPHARLQTVWPDTFGSYKAHRLMNHPFPTTPAGALGTRPFSVICFHGPTKQHNVGEKSWTYKHWIGERDLAWMR